MTDTRSGPTCPFCRAPWTQAMLAELDQMSSPCACCGGAAAEAPATPLPVPVRDLCCAACGRAIYLHPHSAR